jgi:hypothetical protein
MLNCAEHELEVDPMSAVPAMPSTYPWPADLLAFAIQRKVDAFLEPHLDATRRLFPTATSLRVFLELDPEIRDFWYIVFEVEVPKRDVPDFVAAVRRWNDEASRIYPATPVCSFCLMLTRVP